MTESNDARVRRVGVGYALAAYTIWGVAPVYFVWVNFALALEILAHRILWSLPLLVVLVLLGRQWRALRALSRRDVGRLALCAALLSVNWLTFIYAIQIERIAETSLGYFINPLVSLVLGALFLAERMRLAQWLAAGLAAIGVGFELIMLGELPWLGLALAFSFGFYGLIRKQLNLPSAVGLSVETALVAPAALSYLIWLHAWGPDPDRTVGQIAQLAAGGLVTALPLVCFAAAAIRLPLSVLSFFQYLAPSLSLLIAVAVYGETVSDSRWIAFALIWLALVMFSVEGLYHRRRAIEQSWEGT